MTWTQEEKDRYRFSGERYSIRNANGSRPGEYIPQLAGLYAFPRDSNKIPDPWSSSSSSSIFDSSSYLYVSESFVSSSSLEYQFTTSLCGYSSSSSSIQRNAGISLWAIGDNFIVGQGLHDNLLSSSSQPDDGISLLTIGDNFIVDQIVYDNLLSSSSFSMSSISSLSSSSASSLNSSSSDSSTSSSSRSSRSSSSSMSSYSSSSVSSSSVSSQSSSSKSSSSFSSFSSFSSSSQSDAPLPENQTRKAVVVSIEDYPGTGNDLLGYFTNMTNIISGHLNTKFGFEISSRLIDSEATIANVESAFVSATSDLVAGDAFIFFYGGHGSRTYNRDDIDNESDNYDELRVLYGGTWSDDRLRVLIDAIPAGVKVTIIFDSCYSGTGTRNVVTRKPRVLPEESMREIFFSATAEEGLAYIFNGGGFFSKALEKNLRLCGRGITARELHKRIDLEVHWNGQQPQLEGPEALKDSRLFV
jgi:hypothetical protein